MIKKALLDEAIAKVRGMLPGQKDQPNIPLRTGIGAGIGAVAGALPVAMGRKIPEGASGVESAKKMIKLLLAAKGKPAAVIGGAAALGGAAGLGSGLLSKHSSVYRQGFEAKCAEAGMSELQTKQAFLGKLWRGIKGLGSKFQQGRALTKLTPEELAAHKLDWANHEPTGLGGMAHRLGGGYERMKAGPIGGYTRNIGEDLGPALTWAKQHPIYAGGAGAGLMGAGGGIQSMLGDEG